MMGPLEVIVVGFEGERLTGGVARELDDIRSRKIIRVIDLLFVAKDMAGQVTVREVSDLSGSEADALGMTARPDQPGGRVGWFSETDLLAIADQLRPATSALVMLFEHAWAAQLRAAIVDAGGFMVARASMSEDVVDEFDALVSQ
jgi:uncharacterized membrane protein